jgi:AcrR family transcriptional regulator
MSSRAQTSIRDEYKEQTRSRILDAAIALTEEGGEEPLTIAGVATKAGVTDRTVYRHFETRELLVASVWRRMQERVGSEGFPRTADALIDTPRRLFRRFDESPQLIRASVYSPAGLELRLKSNDERQEAMLNSVRDALPKLDENTLRRRAAIAQLIDSAYAWEVMRQFWGFDGEEAGEAAAEALSILLGRRSPEEP